MSDDTIGRYRLDARLGSGSFATVWQGYDPELHVPVAIKVLAEHWRENLEVRERFLTEARLLRKVRDQRIVRVHDIGTTGNDQPYFVMDHADAGTVADLIKQESLAVPAALHLGAEIARAVQVLHEHGVAHRDIKPANLLLTSQVGRAGLSVVVADLGMAKTLSEASGFTLTAGTPAYMAPEQAQGRGFDHRADVYAVAAVTYAMLAGHPPFTGTGLAEIAEAALSQTAPPLHLDEDGAIDTELARALAGDPEGRPATAAHLAERLDELAGVVPTRTQMITPSSPDSTATAVLDTAGTVADRQSGEPRRPTAATQPAEQAAPEAAAPGAPIPAESEQAASEAAAESITPKAAPPKAAPPKATGPTPVLVVLSGLALAGVIALVTWFLLSLVFGG
ncbi:MAG: serine/threonine-protein kinase [Propionibacteriaceae bacterium]